MKCEICGKAASFGNNVSHSKRHTRRNWLPNIQPKMVLINGTKKRVNICTRCLRNQQKTAG